MHKHCSPTVAVLIRQVVVLIRQVPLCISLVSCRTALCARVPLVCTVEWLQEEDIVALVREFCSCGCILEGDLPALQKVSSTGKCDDGEISVKVSG